MAAGAVPQETATGMLPGALPSDEPVDFAVRTLGRRLPRKEAPEGWVKKIGRREGRVWVGFFHLWTTNTAGQRVRRKKEKTLGPGSLTKLEAQQKLADYITSCTGQLTKQGPAIENFTDLWKAFCAVRAGQRSKGTRENLKSLFATHVLPVLGTQAPRDITLTTLQLLVNKLAEDGYSKSAVRKVRTNLKACLEYATDEAVVVKNPARKLALPKVQRKVSERFLSIEEIGALLAVAEPRDHLVLHIFLACGLRPGEALVLRIEDFEGHQLRIDEALKEREKGEAKMGDTKTEESDSYVPVAPDLAQELEAWIGAHPDRDNPRAFLFPNARGTAYSVGHYLKRHLKPLAETIGIGDLTHQALRRTSSTHIVQEGTVKDLQRHMRHSNLETALKHYAKVIPESLRAAAESLDARIVHAVAAAKADPTILRRIPSARPLGTKFRRKSNRKPQRASVSGLAPVPPFRPLEQPNAFGEGSGTSLGRDGQQL